MKKTTFAIFIFALALFFVGVSVFAGDLPDPKKTPGAVNRSLTPEKFYVLCTQRGWTKRFRPPAAYTSKLKKKQLAAGYGHYSDTDVGLYEEDHLISLCLGGAPRSERNLWPQLWDGQWGAKKKDRLEAVLCRMACRGEIDLAEARKEVATDWIAAYKRYVKTKKKTRTAEQETTP